MSEAWNTTSWLDHCICTTDAHGSIVKAEILYGTATADHIPVSFVLKVESLPELRVKDIQTQNVKVEWAKLTECDLQYFYS